jgi:lipoate-protein ligase A
MHGEYKVPGGKLVVADVDVADGRLRNVEISGDFFLLPEDTLWRIRDALEGAPMGDEAQLAARVRDASAGAEMIGITPEGVAIAVLRAVEDGAV